MSDEGFFYKDALNWQGAPVLPKSDRKYILTEKHPEENLYRIVSLKDFGDVKKGQRGGWVASHYNLSHYTDSWVYPEAKVYQAAKVYGGAIVSGFAEVCGSAQVTAGAIVTGRAFVRGSTLIMGDVVVADAKRSPGGLQITSKKKKPDKTQDIKDRILSDIEGDCIGKISSLEELRHRILNRFKKMRYDMQVERHTIWPPEVEEKQNEYDL